MRVSGAGGTDALGAPIVSVQWLAQCNSSVDCYGPSVGTSLAVENREVDHSFAEVEVVEMGRVPSCGTVGSFRMPGHHLNPHVAFPSSCTVHSLRAQRHL